MSGSGALAGAAAGFGSFTTALSGGLTTLIPGLTAGSSLTNILTSGLAFAGYGAATGGLTSLITKGDVMKGMTTGALVGGLTGGVLQAVNPDFISGIAKSGVASSGVASGGDAIADFSKGAFSKPEVVGLDPSIGLGESSTLMGPDLSGVSAAASPMANPVTQTGLSAVGTQMGTRVGTGLLQGAAPQTAGGIMGWLNDNPFYAGTIGNTLAGGLVGLGKASPEEVAKAAAEAKGEEERKTAQASATSAYGAPGQPGAYQTMVAQTQAQPGYRIISTPQGLRAEYPGGQQTPMVIGQLGNPPTGIMRFA